LNGLSWNNLEISGAVFLAGPFDGNGIWKHYECFKLLRLMVFSTASNLTFQYYCYKKGSSKILAPSHLRKEYSEVSATLTKVNLQQRVFVVSLFPLFFVTQLSRSILV